MLNDWISVPGLMLLVVAHSAPVVAAWIAGSRAAWPLDFGLELRDGERLLGAHKTWRGLLVAMAATGLAAGLLELPIQVGAGFGALAMAGDALSSFTKRRLRLAPGAWIPGLDQLPEGCFRSWPATGSWNWT